MKPATARRPKKPATQPVVRPLRVKYATPQPKADLMWLETAHFLGPYRETVLLAWPRTGGFVFRTGRHDGRRYVLSNDKVPHEQPTFFAFLK